MLSYTKDGGVGGGGGKGSNLPRVPDSRGPQNENLVFKSSKVQIRNCQIMVTKKLGGGGGGYEHRHPLNTILPWAPIFLCTALTLTVIKLIKMKYAPIKDILHFLESPKYYTYQKHIWSK